MNVSITFGNNKWTCSIYGTHSFAIKLICNQTYFQSNTCAISNIWDQTKLQSTTICNLHSVASRLICNQIHWQSDTVTFKYNCNLQLLNKFRFKILRQIEKKICQLNSY